MQTDQSYGSLFLFIYTYYESRAHSRIQTTHTHRPLRQDHSTWTKYTCKYTHVHLKRTFETYIHMRMITYTAYLKKKRNYVQTHVRTRTFGMNIWNVHAPLNCTQNRTRTLHTRHTNIDCECKWLSSTSTPLPAPGVAPSAAAAATSATPTATCTRATPLSSCKIARVDTTSTANAYLRIRMGFLKI
jgi:hypothetical protein